jgi:hypothetical protein
MSTNGLSELRLSYKKAVNEWIDAIRAEESLATTDHSMTAMEKWDDAHFKSRMRRRKHNRRGMHTRTLFAKRTTGFEGSPPLATFGIQVIPPHLKDSRRDSDRVTGTAMQL